MLKGKNVNLRTFRSRDLDTFLDLHSDVAARGDHFPLMLFTESGMRQRLEKDGYWSDDSGTLLIVDATDDRIIGMVAFFRPVFYYTAFEIGYLVFNPEDRGKGYTTEAMSLFVDYLFKSKHIDRLQLQIEPGNIGSRRIAEKCGFSFEGIARRAIVSNGSTVDIGIYSLLREEHQAGKS